VTEPRSLAAQLRELEASWSAVARSLLARRWAAPGLDITHPQYYALHHVCEQRSMSIAALGRAMRMEESVAARVVDRLARAGLVQRRLDPSDRRTVMIEPTTHGRETLAAVRRLRFDELKSMLQRLDDVEREELIRLFNKMAAGDGEAEA
jgi:DNA-binding MarR family transcriptional regulator